MRLKIEVPEREVLSWNHVQLIIVVVSTEKLPFSFQLLLCRDNCIDFIKQFSKLIPIYQCKYFHLHSVSFHTAQSKTVIQKKTHNSTSVTTLFTDTLNEQQYFLLIIYNFLFICLFCVCVHVLSMGKLYLWFEIKGDIILYYLAFIKSILFSKEMSLIASLGKPHAW